MSDSEDLSQKAFDHFVELLEKKDFKKQLIAALNEDIDIPLINEKTEKKILDAIYKLVIKLLKNTDISK
tara:strand:- start:87 stop:293 length:207 start_codon:yes stop_codon:yes gene_type:complete